MRIGSEAVRSHHRTSEPPDAVERIGSLDPALVAIEARRIADGRRESAIVERPALRRFERPAPSLAGYDALLAGSTR